jgi:hypothetical protein
MNKKMTETKQAAPIIHLGTPADWARDHKAEATAAAPAASFCAGCANLKADGTCRHTCLTTWQDALASGEVDYCDAFSTKQTQLSISRKMTYQMDDLRGPSEAQQEAAEADEKMGPGFGYSAPCHLKTFHSDAIGEVTIPAPAATPSKQGKLLGLPSEPKGEGRYIVYIRNPRIHGPAWFVLLETDDLATAYELHMEDGPETILRDLIHKVNIQVCAL